MGQFAQPKPATTDIPSNKLSLLQQQQSTTGVEKITNKLINKPIKLSAIGGRPALSGEVTMMSGRVLRGSPGAM